jgi:hypothetical protein
VYSRGSGMSYDMIVFLAGQVGNKGRITAGYTSHIRHEDSRILKRRARWFDGIA